MTFKEALPSTESIFFDEGVFAEYHNVEYRNVLCVLDTDVSAKNNNHGIVNQDVIKLIISVEECRMKDIEPKGEGSTLDVDGTEYFVDSWAEEQGVYVINLNRYGSQVI